MIKNFLLNNKLTVVFFAIYFVVGCLVFSDYGAGWDEEAQRLANGRANLDYILDGNGENLIRYGDKYHGPIWEIFLYGSIEKIFKITKEATIFELRHFLNFCLFFIGTIYLFLTLLKLKIETRIAIIASALYVLMPRVFEDSFTNSKDTVFLSIVSISNFYLINWLQNRTYKTLVLFAVISGIAISVRILGILIPIFAVLIYFLLSKEKLTDIFKILIYLFATCALMVLFWPVLWEGPIYHFINAFKEMKSFPFENSNLYFGKMIQATELPWHYLPFWFFATTPLFLTITFIFTFISLSFLHLIKIILEKKLDFLTSLFAYQAAMFFAPFIIVIAFNSVVYDGWRHVFFVASPFIIIIAMGLNFFFNKVKISNYKTVFQLLFLLPIAYLIFWNIKNHPYQNVYFNKFITNNYDVRQSFDVDYWGVSYKQGLKKLIEFDKNDTLIYSASNYPGYQAKFAVTDNKPILFVDSVEKANYFLSNYRWHPEDYPYKKIDSIMVDEYEIMGIYRVK